MRKVIVKAKAKKAAKRAGSRGVKPKAERLTDYARAAYNPRKISAEAAAGLRASLETFGDLSGLVVNRRTGRIVCGHQRTGQLATIAPRVLAERITWSGTKRVAVGREGERFASRERYGTVTLPGGATFAVREVDWPEWFEKLANVTANSETIQGDWSDELERVLTEARAEGGEAAEDLYADLMLAELGAKPKAAAKEDEGGVSASYQVVVQCADEGEQQAVYERLTKLRMRCKCLTIPE